MKVKNAVGLIRSEDAQLFIFYLFMMLCGFVAGTMIWTKLDIPFNAADMLPKSAALFQIALCIALPAAGAFAVFLLLALFAGGWMVFPAAVYILGSVFGYFSCVLFSEQSDIKTAVSYITLAAAYLCCAAVLMYFCVFTHQLSRELSGGGESCISAYRRCLRSAVFSAVLIAVISGVFSGIISVFSKL